MELRIAQTETELAEIGKLRYQVFVAELGLPYRGVDHTNKILLDKMDAYSTNFFICEGDKVIGATRNTILSDGDFEDSEYLDLPTWLQEFDKQEICLTTKFVVDKDFRKTAVSYRLTNAEYAYARQRKVRLGFLDCLPNRWAVRQVLGWRRPHRA